MFTPIFAQIIAVLIIAGLLIWVANSLPFIGQPIPKVITVFVVVVAVLWLLNLFVPMGCAVPMPRR